MARPPAESRTTTAGKWLLALVVPGSAMALGSVPTGALVLMSALAAVSCGLLWIDSDARTSRASRYVLLALAILLGMTILQAIPLPAGLTHTIAPATADIWERALVPLHEPGPAWHPLSIAPPATRVEILRGFFYGCVFLSALRIATLERGEQFLIRLVVFSTAAMAFAALGHTATGVDKIFGIYRPRELYAYRPEHFAPLLNTNHLAAYLNMGACVSLGTLLSRRSIPRALTGSAMVVCAATSVWQGSRGATGALLFGVVLTFALTFYSRRRFESTRVGGIILAACALAAAGVVSVSLSDVARVHLLSHDLTKVDVAKSSMTLIAASPWFGVGRGGFETVFSSVHHATLYFTFTNPEDIFIQWFVEWGVPVSVAGMALLGWALRPQLLLVAVRPAVGVWVAIVAGLLQELVDYHFEVPGVVALATVCVAIVVSGRTPARESNVTSKLTGPRLTAFVLSSGTIAAIVCVWPNLDHTLAEDERRLSAMSIDKHTSAEQFRSAVRDSLLRYPAEPFVPLMGAVRALANDEGSVIPWVARSLERNPRFGRAHFVLARSLATHHPAQARLEYRLAYENDERLRDSVVKEASPLIEDFATALELVPDGLAGAPLLDVLVVAIAPRLPSTAVALDIDLQRRNPALLAPFRRRAEAEARDAIEKAAWCVGATCMNEAIAAADELSRRDPEKCAGPLLIARLRVAKGEVGPALDGLERAASAVVDRADCQRQFITLAIESGQPRRGELALDSLVRGGCGATAECVNLYNWAGSMEEARGHYVLAVRLYHRVLDLTPEREDLLQHIGELGNQPGLMPEALEAYNTLATRHPADPRWPAAIMELRSQTRPQLRMPAP